MTSPVAIRVNGKDFILTDVNEQRVKDRLYRLYLPETLVTEWVGGELSNELMLKDVFNQ